jgi:hypothetical protein
MCCVDFAKTSKERLRGLGVVSKPPVHHRELEQHAFFILKLLTGPKRAFVHFSEIVPSFDFGVVPHQRAQRLGIAG